MGSAVRVAKATNMGLSMAGDSSAISAVPAAIRHSHSRNDHIGYQAAADNLVPGLLSNWHRPKETLENPGHDRRSHSVARVFRKQKLRNRGFPELP